MACALMCNSVSVSTNTGYYSQELQEGLLPRLVSPKVEVMGFHTVLVAGLAVTAAASNCRDVNQWPFAATSVWNTPLGTGATFSPAAIFSDHEPKYGMFADDDYYIVTTATDPVFPWYSQGWWGQPGGEAHCVIQSNAQLVGKLAWPGNYTVTAFGNNNAAAILQPDGDTLVLTQPLYRCNASSPILSILDKAHGTTSIRGGAE